LDPENIITTVSTIPLLVFSDFFAILLPFFIWHSPSFHIWTCTLDTENIITNIPYFIAILWLLLEHFPDMERP
jgi:hypothetical protein